MNKIKNFFKNRMWVCSFLIILIVSIVACIFLFNEKLPLGHDLCFHLSRINGLSNNLKYGDIVASIHDGLYGYGYANGLFYGNLLVYFPAFLVKCGVDIILAYKIFIFIITFLTGLSMYFCVKKISKKEIPALISSVLYITCAYRMTDVIIRAALGEIISFAIIPIIILGLYEILFDNEKKWYLFSIGFVLLIQTHLITTIIMFIICFLIILFNYQKIFENKKRLKALILSVIFGILIGAYFIFPLIEQYMSSNLVVNTEGSIYPIWLNTIPIEKIFLGFIYYDNGMFIPGGLGIIFIILAILKFKIKEKTELIKFADICLVSGIICLIMTTDIFPWQELSKYASLIQFPWRLLLPCMLFFSVACSIIFYYYIKNKTNKLFLICIVILYCIFSCLLNTKLSRPSLEKSYGYYPEITSLDDYYIGSGEYLPVGTDVTKLVERGSKITTNNNELNLKYIKEGLKINIKYSNDQSNTYIELPLLYYKGYKVKSKNNKEYFIKKGDNNLIKINLLNSSDEIDVYYSGTTIQKISYCISGLTILLFIGYIVIKRKK